MSIIEPIRNWKKKKKKIEINIRRERTIVQLYSFDPSARPIERSHSWTRLRFCTIERRICVMYFQEIDVLILHLLVFPFDRTGFDHSLGKRLPSKSVIIQIKSVLFTRKWYFSCDIFVQEFTLISFLNIYFGLYRIFYHISYLELGN